MNVTTTIKGIPELLLELQRLSEAAQGRVARNMSMAGARIVAREARVLAPVVTGALRRSIKARRSRQQFAKGQALAFVNASVFYARFVEYGTVHQPAHSFLRAALDEHQPEMRAKMMEIGLNGLQREILRQLAVEDLGEEV